MEIGLAAERVREDRISKLDDAVLGHVLSFLPSKQAARAAVLSSRWRDAFAGVHTVSLEEPEGGLPAYDHGRRPRDSDEYHDVWLDPPSSFGPAITAAIVARHRSPAATPPLRAFRVALHDYKCRDSIAVDQWVSYALKQAGPELELDLRLKHLPICCRGGGDAAEINVLFLYTVLRGLFSCSALRTLRIGPCKLPPPPAISLPSLHELLLTRVSDAEEVVQRLISACPRLADLTLESCDTVTTLSLFDTRLRRLALSCCHNLSHVAVDVSELSVFEYRGNVPDIPFLITFGATGWFLAMPSLASCTVDICSGEVSAPEELARLTTFLHHFASAKHLRLRSARLCPDIGTDEANTRLPMFSNLHHLELWGFLPPGSNGEAIVATAKRILQHTPNLEVLSFVFETGTAADVDALPSGYYQYEEEELLDAHRLTYNQYDVLDTPSCGAMIPFLLNRVSEINLVHYQGGRAHRTLAKFLLCNAVVMDELWCEFAEGPLWMQTQLMREMKSWVMNENANTVFR